MNDALNFAISFILQVVSFVFVARFLLQACRVDFYNPISQGLVKITDPVLKPMRMVVPGYRNLDFASFLAAVVVQILLVMSLSALNGGGYVGSFGTIIASGVLQVVLECIRIFWWSILIVIIAGWIAPGTYHPALALLQQITEPLLAPARKLLPPMGGIDFSPIIVFLILGVIERILPQVFMSML
ncbi:MAG: YggT family protein [Gammaproteobacteria bacterium]|jgi:YggT family protein|nr:YggT family protein [Gammaproteobacteria bacterium]